MAVKPPSLRLLNLANGAFRSMGDPEKFFKDLEELASYAMARTTDVGYDERDPDHVPATIAELLYTDILTARAVRSLIEPEALPNADEYARLLGNVFLSLMAYSLADEGFDHEAKTASDFVLYRGRQKTGQKDGVVARNTKDKGKLDRRKVLREFAQESKLSGAAREKAAIKLLSQKGFKRGISTRTIRQDLKEIAAEK